MTLAEKVKAAGVAGAGGAGFPAHVKLAAQAEWYLANGAECEPLLHKDRELMVHFAPRILRGLALAGEATGASRLAAGVKEKNKEAVQALRSALDGSAIQIHTFGDYYPVGDEYELVYGITGKLIPPKGLPLDVGAVVNNVETLYNIAQAADGVPVTDTFLTVAGSVKEPLTARVPVGMPMREVLQLAGGPAREPFAVMDSGLLMGRLVEDLDQPVTKITGGLIILPAEHPLIQRRRTPLKAMRRIGHAACDQCAYCTMLCPRYMLGYDVQPHLVMRGLGYSRPGAELWNEHALLCSRCGLCTLYACPESLYPREACVQAAADLQAAGKADKTWPREVEVRPMKDARRVPISRLMRRLGVTEYDSRAAYKEMDIRPARVIMPLLQHAGAPSIPVVKTGEPVKRGQLVARIPEGKLGAAVHASIDGTVTETGEKSITIERK